MPKNPGTAERGEHPGASIAVFSSRLGMHVQLQYRSHCASRSPSPGTYNKQPGDSESLTHENTALRVFSRWGFFSFLALLFKARVYLRRGRQKQILFTIKPVVTLFSNSYLLETLVPL